MATLRAISLRLKSVKSIQKITKSMKMVSAAKYARAERELKAARPMGEETVQFFEKAELTKDIDEKETDVDQQKKNLIYIAVTSDRGLCGAVHTTVARHIRNSITKSKDEVKIVCIGDKSRGILSSKFGERFLFVCTQIGRLPPTFLDACRIANEIFQSDYEYDLGKIIFNKYQSAISYLTTEINLYNFNTIISSQNIQNFEDADEETIKCFAEFSMAELLFYALKEAACSEQAARMTAMDGASKNAGDMIQGLTLAFNRTRQAAITRELIEIISGASAL